MSFDEHIRSDHIRSVVQSCPTLCDPMNRSTPGLPVHHQLPEFTDLMSIESVMPSSYLILCRPLLLLPLISPSLRVKEANNRTCLKGSYSRLSELTHGKCPQCLEHRKYPMNGNQHLFHWFGIKTGWT